MDKFHFLQPACKKAILAALVLLSLGFLSAWIFSPQASAKDGGDAALLDQFRHFFPSWAGVGLIPDLHDPLELLCFLVELFAQGEL